MNEVPFHISPTWHSSFVKFTEVSSIMYLIFFLEVLFKCRKLSGVCLEGQEHIVVILLWLKCPVRLLCLNTGSPSAGTVLGGWGILRGVVWGCQEIGYDHRWLSTRYNPKSDVTWGSCCHSPECLPCHTSRNKLPSSKRLPKRILHVCPCLHKRSSGVSLSLSRGPGLRTVFIIFPQRRRAVDGFEKQQHVNESVWVGWASSFYVKNRISVCWKAACLCDSQYLFIIPKWLNTICVVFSIPSSSVYWAPTFCLALPGATAVIKTDAPESPRLNG